MASQDDMLRAACLFLFLARLACPLRATAPAEAVNSQINGTRPNFGAKNKGWEVWGGEGRHVCFPSTRHLYSQLCASIYVSQMGAFTRAHACV